MDMFALGFGAGAIVMFACIVLYAIYEEKVRAKKYDLFD